MTLFLAMLWIQSGLRFVQPDGDVFAGNTQVVLETDRDPENIVGLELFVNGRSIRYQAELPFEFTIDFSEYGQGEIELKAVLSLFSGDPIVAVKNGRNFAQFFNENVVYVSVPVLVQGTEKTAIPELGPESFELRVDDKLQKVEEVYTTERPINVVVLIDCSGSMEGRLSFVKRGVNQFLDLLKPIDPVQIMGFNAETFQVCDFETDKELVKRKMVPMRPGGDTNLYGALWSGVNAATKTSGRRAVLLFTDGHQEVNKKPENYLEKSLEECVQLAQSNGIPVFTIGVGPAVVPEILQAVSDETGGRAFVLRNRASIVEAFQSIGHQLGQQYVLCYYSANHRAGWHTVDLEVPQFKLELHYPQRLYFQ